MYAECKKSLFWELFSTMYEVLTLFAITRIHRLKISKLF